MHSTRRAMMVQNIFVGLVFLFAFVIIFYRLGSSSLKPWDEAWYATVANKLVITKNLFELNFNGSHFWDHPPLGIYAQAIGILLFGSNELGARLPMAVMGLAAVFAVYQTVKTLKNKQAGIVAALILLSCRWFLVRVRSANLEAPLLLFQVLTFYFSYKATTKKEAFYLWLCFGLALISKSVISITLLPLVLLGTWRVIRKDGLPWLQIVLATALTVTPWYLYNYLTFGEKFLRKNIFLIGLRSGTTEGLNKEVLELTWLYLRSAIHRWYWPMVISLGGSLLFLNKRSVRWAIAYWLLSAFPYSLSSQVHIWHLLPILPATAILIGVFIYELTDFFRLKSFDLIWVVLVLLITLSSIKNYVNENMYEKQVSNEAKVGLAASKIDMPTYTQDGTYLPTLVFYTGRNIRNLSLDPNEIAGLPRPLLIITKDYLLPSKTEYEIKERFGDTIVAIYR